ncbi:MAG: vitamin K epoxide reductase family protein [Dactylosporangium sp.]|nr:vitamin K epoxide reductase family protein [Dactylosporangium sp.]NNJ61251.1 vitamin K epoxide reductase family protein [Dactylosporangium sp.]
MVISEKLRVSSSIDVPRWLPWTSLVLAVGGLGVSIYLTHEHYSAETTLSCPNTGALNCEMVTSSEQSTLFGIPVALLGMAYFVAMMVVVVPPAWRMADPWINRLFTLARLAAVGGGICYVLFLVYAELFLIDSICIWCTVVHVLAFALFVVVAFGTALVSPRR